MSNSSVAESGANNPVAFAFIESLASELSTGKVELHEDLTRDHDDEPDLTDVLTVATLFVSFHAYPESIELNMQGVTAFDRMQLDHEDVAAILEESAEEVASLQAALAG